MRQLYWLDGRILGTIFHADDGSAIFESSGNQRFAASRYATMIIPPRLAPDWAAAIAAYPQRLKPVPHLERERAIAYAKFG